MFENKIPDWATKVTNVSKFVALLLFILLPFAGFFSGWTMRAKLDVDTPQFTTNYVSQRTCDSANLGPDALRTFKGIIKKEKIPSELELGEYWYYIYFSEPYLLEYSAVGRPVYMDKLEIVGPDDDFYNIEDFLNVPVVLTGNFTWGYAESTVLRIVSIAKLK